MLSSESFRNRVIKGQSIMAFETLKAEILMLWNQMEEQTKDRREVAFQIHEKIAELRAMGMPVPDDFLRLEKQLEQEFGRTRKS